jgi:hypothetical protein
MFLIVLQLHHSCAFVFLAVANFFRGLGCNLPLYIQQLQDIGAVNTAAQVAKQGNKKVTKRWRLQSIATDGSDL